jgi:hypothetical protein
MNGLYRGLRAHSRAEIIRQALEHPPSSDSSQSRPEKAVGGRQGTI